MTTLNSGDRVPSRTYHFLADWSLNDRSNTIREMFSKDMVLELNKDEFRTLFHLATQVDYENL